MKNKLIKTLSSGYKRLSTKGLSLAVNPDLIGDVPTLDQKTPVFYVLDTYSRSDSMLLEYEINKYQLPSALQPIQLGQINETAAMLFVRHRRAKTELSPRLMRLVQYCLDNPDTDINLVPVTILWGRAPDKEDSFFKLLMADEWRVPSIGKQLFNVGVMGRDTFVQFYKPKSLQTLINDGKKQTASTDTSALTHYIQNRLKGYLNRQRTSILGPDLSDKRNIINNIMQADSVQEAISTKANTTGKSASEIKKEVQHYIDEIASDYSYSVIRVFDHMLSRLWNQLYDGIEVRHFERVRKLAPDYQIIYVPCHRSHMDYLLLSYVVHVQGLRVPNVAAGANLNIPILGEILRSSGAFFMRRSFKDNPLYGTVFKEYVHNLMQRNAPIEYFIEGGRSRSGRLLAPKLGMLAMTVNSYLRSPAKPVVFIPAYISYERIMEGATYVGELKGKPKESENLLGLLKTARKIERIFGTVHLSFGEPLYLDNFLKKFEVDIKLATAEQQQPTKIQDNDAYQQNQDKQNAMIQNLGVKIMQQINRSAVINPVSLIALVLLSTPKSALDETQFLSQLALYQQIAQDLPYDPDIYLTDLTPNEMLAYGKKLKLIENSPHILGDMIKVADKQAPMLSYFRNNILHLFILPSLLASLVQKNGRISTQNLYEIGELLYPFLQAELFLKYAKRNIHDRLAEVLAVLIKAQVVVDLGGGMVCAPDGTSEAYQKLLILASPAKQSLERYFMALTLLFEYGDCKLTSTQVVDLCHLVGQRMSVLYGEDLPDMFDKALFSGFINTLIRTDYIRVNDQQKLCFDERVTKIAQYARLVLSPDVRSLLHHVADFNEDKINWLTQTKKK